MRRAILSTVALSALWALAALAGPSSAGAQAIGGGCGVPPIGTSTQFEFDGKGDAQGFRVPANVSQVTITAEGAHGGEIKHSAAGGAGGSVEATFAVTAGECLDVYVGGFGWQSGGDGFANGGGGGTIRGDASDGNNGAGGGGASAVLRGLGPLVIAGGGGGGGGSGTADDADGGSGGDGGDPPNDGGRHRDGGRGGKGGSEDGGNGGSGSGQGGVIEWGAGGGGGGGFNGGGGGRKGSDPDNSGDGTGGGGGGGGSSAILGTPIGQIQHGPSGRSCVYGHFSPQCHGQVTITWWPDIQGLIFPLRPAVRVLPFDLTPASENLIPAKIPIVLTPASPPRSGATAPSPVVVRLELFHRHKGKWRRAGTLTETATADGPRQLEVAVPKRVRKALRRKSHGRMRIDAFNAATGERIDRDQLRFD